jgi:hypothetical protein
MFGRETTVSPALAKAMADTIYHREPNANGYYVSCPISPDFRRLSIIDLQEDQFPVALVQGLKRFLRIPMPGGRSSEPSSIASWRLLPNNLGAAWLLEQVSEYLTPVK